MKKLMLVVAACGLIVACGQKGKNAENANNTTDSVNSVVGDTLVYEGEGPAADGTYKYMLSIYGDSIKECAYQQVAVTPKGGEETMSKTTGLPAFIDKDGKKYIRVQANKEDSVTFLQLNDSTLRLVSKDFKEAGEGTNTDLKLKK